VEEGERFGEGKERFGFLGLFAIKIWLTLLTIIIIIIIVIIIIVIIISIGIW
jgi:hypothetical protein